MNVKHISMTYPHADLSIGVGSSRHPQQALLLTFIVLQQSEQIPIKVYVIVPKTVSTVWHRLWELTNRFLKKKNSEW
jgi:hypothetical protein